MIADDDRCYLCCLTRLVVRDDINYFQFPLPDSSHAEEEQYRSHQDLEANPHPPDVDFALRFLIILESY